MRGQQDKSLQILSKNMGWDPCEIIGDAYDVEKTGPWKDNPGPDSPARDVNVSMGTTYFETPDVRPQGHPPVRHGDPNPGKPM